MTEAVRNKVPEFLTGGGEMGERIRNFDWKNSPLGEPEHWEQSLKTCVRIMLRSSQPIWIGWGKELIKLYNDAYIDIVRGKHPFALGQPASVVWKDIWNDIEPLLTSAMVRDEGTYVESQLLIMERSGFPEETYYTFSYTPVLGDDGKPAGIICYNTADTDRIINERSIDTLNKLSRNTLGVKTEKEIFETTASALSENQFDFPFTLFYKISDDATEAELNAYSVIPPGHKAAPLLIDLRVQDPQGWNIRKILETREPAMLYDLNERFGLLPTGKWDIQPSRAIVIPVLLKGKENPAAVLIAALNPFRQPDDKYLNFLRLLTEQFSQALFNVHVMEEERARAIALEELDKSKTIFFSNISHEFRTPLTLILGTIEELIQDTDTPKNLERIELAHRNAMRMLKLVNTLLDFSRIESGRQQAVYVPVDLVTHTKNLVSNFRSITEKAGLQLNINTESIDQPVFVDRQMWEKIVFNLLSNAFKYTMEGSITVSISSTGTHAIFSVQDTGIGIPEKEIPHMFERFHRVEHTTGRTYEGTGIGLSLIKELVHLHGGSISLESKLGKGSTFIVSIPLGKEHLPQAKISLHPMELAEEISNFYIDEATALLEPLKPHVATESVKTSAKKEPLVMIVDDNADMLQHIQSLIGKKYKTVTAVNGREALDKIKMQSPSVIISDVMMPVMDGIQLLKEVRKDPQTQNIPVILITARAGEESKIEGYSIGADDYLVKPFSAKELIARITSQINLSKKRATVEKQLHSLFEQAPSAILILKGPEFVLELVNERALQIMGKTKEESVGRKFADVLPELESQGYFDLMRMVYNSGERFTADEAPVSFFQDGQRVDTFVKYVFQPLRDEEDDIIGIMIVGDDVAAQVHARKKIEDSEHELRILAETLPQMVWVSDKDGKIDYASKDWEDYSGISNVNEAWKEMVHPDEWDSVMKSWETDSKKGNSFRYEVRLKNKNGEYRWHYATGEPVKDSSGNVVKWIGALTDVHVQKTFTEKLEEEVMQRTEELVTANKELESFNYIASHDLQEPLRKIQIFIDRIKHAKPDENPGVYFEKINGAAIRMRQLIESVLSYSRLNKDTVYTKVDLNQILADVVADYEMIIKEKGAVIINDKLPKIHANVQQMNQLFSNLISNALKFTTEKPRIKISCKLQTLEEIRRNKNTFPSSFEKATPKQKFIQLRFADNGIGFEPQYKEQIFQLFQRLHSKSEYSGTGVGLSIVKKIVEQHHGHISAESKNNKGAVFTIWLPV